jgi:hypothetical protein
LRITHETRSATVDAAITVSNTSKPFVVWNTQDSMCEKHVPNAPAAPWNHGPAVDLPDTPPNAFVDAAGITHLFTGDTTSRVSVGSSILENKRNCTVVLNSTYATTPQLYASDEFIDATYALV